MWRAYLADGRVVDHDGENSHIPLLDLILRFEVFAPNGAMLARVEPGPREYVIWRWTRTNDGATKRTVGCKLGILNRDSGEADVRYLDAATGEWSPTTDFELLPVERA